MDGVLLSRMWSQRIIFNGTWRFFGRASLQCLFLLAFPFVAYYLIKQYIRFGIPKGPLPFFQIGLSAYNGIMLLVLLFLVFAIFRISLFSFGTLKDRFF